MVWRYDGQLTKQIVVPETMSQKSPLQRTQFIMMFFAFAFGMILSSLLTQFGKQKASNEAHKEILFIYRGTEKYLEDVVAEDREKLNSIAREKLAILENAALRQYFMDEANKSNQSVDQLIKTIMPWKPVTEADIASFYAQNKANLQKTYAEVHQQIQALLERQRIKTAKAALLKKLIQQGDLALLPIN